MIARRRKFKRLDYHIRKYENPFFRRKRRKVKVVKISGWTWRGKFLIFAFLFLFIGLGYLFFFSSLFTIKNIVIYNLARASEEEIKDIVWQQTKERKFLIGKQNNLLLFNSQELIKSLNVDYGFEKLEINKKLFNTLLINIQEKSYAFIWREGDKYYYADTDGYVIDEVNPLEIKQKKYPLIQNLKEKKVFRIGQKIAESEDSSINYIINLFNKIQVYDTKNDLKIERFIIDDEVNTIKLVISDGPILYFNISEDIERQIEKLMVIKNEKLKSDFYNKTYIDLRYGDRVYYR